MVSLQKPDGHDITLKQDHIFSDPTFQAVRSAFGNSVKHLSLEDVEAKSSANFSKRNYTSEIPTTLYTVMNRHGGERHSVSESSESEDEDEDQEEDFGN